MKFITRFTKWLIIKIRIYMKILSSSLNVSRWLKTTEITVFNSARVSSTDFKHKAPSK